MSVQAHLDSGSFLCYTRGTKGGVVDTEDQHQIGVMLKQLYAERRCNYFVCSEPFDRSRIEDFLEREATGSLEGAGLTLTQQMQAAPGLYPVLFVRFKRLVPRAVLHNEIEDYIASLDRDGESEYVYRVGFMSRQPAANLFRIFKEIVSVSGAEYAFANGPTGMRILGNLRQGESMFTLWIGGEPLPENPDCA